MHYQITAPPTAGAAKQAEELGRLLKYARQLSLQFVTVAGGYKPTRARLTLLTVPDNVADQTARVMQILSENEDALKVSAMLKLRAEWKHLAILTPTTPDAPPIDGALLEGWDSACLNVTYRPGRASALLRCCAEDAARLHALAVDGWAVVQKPNPLTMIALTPGKPYNGLLSFTPVPGGLTGMTRAVTTTTSTAPAMLEPLADDIRAALTTDESGIVLGVGLEGEAVRLARRSMVLALNAPAEQRGGALLAMIRRGMQAGLGIVVAAPRSLLPQEALAVWETRVRLLDVQDVASSCAIPWRQIAPDLLAQAVAGPTASLDALPSRFAAVLDALGASSLKVPAVLGLATMPADNLRGVLASGGLIVIPQDGDAASLLIARLLAAYLATPPHIGRGVLLISDPALVPPPDLRDQAIQIVLGERADALLRLHPFEMGWRLAGPDGASVATLQSDLLAQPAAGAGALVESILSEIGSASADSDSVAEEAGWWASSERTDDLDATSEANEGEEPIEVDQVDEDRASAAIPERPVAKIAPFAVASEAISPVVAALPELIAPDHALNELFVANNVDALDAALERLLDALMTTAEGDTTTRAIQAAVAREDFAAAEAVAVLWLASAATDARPWTWRAVLTADDAERVTCAAQALSLDATSPYAPLLTAVLNALLDSGDPIWEVETDMTEDVEPWFPGEDDREDMRAFVARDANPATFLSAPGSEVAANDLLANVASTSFADMLATPSAQVDDTDQGADDLADWLALTNDAETLPPLSGGQRVPPLTDDWAARDTDASEAQTAFGANPNSLHAATFDTIDPQQHPEAVPMPIMPPIMPPVAVVPSPFVPVPAPTHATDTLDDPSIRAAWQWGASVPDLTARLVASGLDAASARARVRQAISGRQASASTVPALLAPSVVAPIMPPALEGATPLSAITTPITKHGELSDDQVWTRWQAGAKTDDLVLAICGRRGGPAADAARDRMYMVVIPRTVAALEADDLVDALAEGQNMGSDSRYPILMQRLARSAAPPSGMLERSLRKRLIAIRQEA